MNTYKISSRLTNFLKRDEALHVYHFVLSVIIYKIFYSAFYIYFPVFSGGSAYFEPSFLLPTLTNGKFLLLYISCTVLPLIYFRDIDWTVFDWSVKYFMVVLTFLLTWILVTYDYSFFFNHWHAPERILLLGSWILFILYPSFIGVFLSSCFIILSQFNYGPQYYHLFHYRPLLLISSAYLAILVLLKWTRKADDTLFLFTSICLVMGGYLKQALAKASLGSHPLEWMFTYRLSVNIGLLKFLGWYEHFPDFLNAWFPVVLPYLDRPIAIATMLMEFGVLLTFFHRQYSRIILIILTGFHISVAIVSGAFFWTWVLVDVGLLIVLTVCSEEYIEGLYRWRNFLLSIILIGLIPFLEVYTRSLAWWETRYNYRLSLEAVTDQNRRYELSKLALAPHHKTLTFVLDEQKYLINEPILDLSSYSYKKAREINKQIDKYGLKVLPALKERLGKNPFREKNTKAFKQFIKQYLMNYSQSSPSPFVREILQFIQPPMFYYTNYKPAKQYRLEEIPGRIRKVKVRFTESISRGMNSTLVDSKIINTITVKR